VNRQQRRQRSTFDPSRRAQPGASEYDRLPSKARRGYVVGLEQASERLASELNATRLALAVMLDRHGGEAMIGDADVERIDGRTIVSSKAEIGGWLFRLVEKGRVD